MDGLTRVEYEKKIWGKTALVAKRPGFTVHHLAVVPRSYCSIHLHEHRFNGFFIIQGQMTIREFLAPDRISEESTHHVIELKAGDYYEVAPGVCHQFRSEEGCEALEIYFPPDVREDDIRRFSVGGLVEEA
jgi:mannose-6-phosphate isomerase-like protein (cupin superfamily)